MVPSDWVHPVDERGRHIPMHYRSHKDAMVQWERDLREWIVGERLWRDEQKVNHWDGRVLSVSDYVAEVRASAPAYRQIPADPDYKWYAGDQPERPRPGDYMPSWPNEHRTHFMMYEDTSEGTPISPAFATADELAHWLADNEASAFGGMTATYDQWLRMIERGSAHSATLISGRIISGVADVGSD
jgi:hypothetical protein